MRYIEMLKQPNQGSKELKGCNKIPWCLRKLSIPEVIEYVRNLLSPIAIAACTRLERADI
jgi:hypothetical protein